MTKLGAANSPGKTKSVLDVMVQMLDSEDIPSKARRISAADLLQKLKSGKDKTAKLIFIALAISEILDKTNLSDLAALFDKLFSQKEDGMDNPKATPVDTQKETIDENAASFVKKYRVKDMDLKVIQKVLEGIILKNFDDALEISGSNANKRIRAMCKRLGLKNRAQLIYVATKRGLISLDLPCLEGKDDLPNVAKK